MATLWKGFPEALFVPWLFDPTMITRIALILLAAFFCAGCAQLTF